MKRENCTGGDSSVQQELIRKVWNMRPTGAFRVTVCLCLLSAGLQSITSAGESPNPDRFRAKAVRIDRKIELTGRLSDPAWKLATPVTLDFEVQPGENAAARQRTLVYVLYNSECIYFGFNCLDSAAKLMRANITDRDQMLDDDFVGVLLDTYGTMQGAYEFFVNPYGIQGDAMRTGNNEDFSFDCIWYSSAQVSDSGYTAELAIPFKSLRFTSSPGQHWILELVRNLPRDSRYMTCWTTIARNNPCIPCQSGTLDGVADITTSNNLELLPYAMGVQSGALNDVGDPNSRYASGSVNGRVGAGVRYAPSSSFAVAGVINPDFGEVESDAAQISVNNTFAIFYPERRPFYLEGADLFSTSAQVFYSRMINDPLVSAKITEKSGSFSLAYLGAEDRRSPFIIPGEEQSDFVASNVKSLNNVVRGKYALGKESFIGGLITTRNFANAHNYVGTIDWNILFGGIFYFSGQGGLTDTKELQDTALFSSDRRFGSTPYTASFDGERYTGSGLQVDLVCNARNYYFDLGAVGVTPTFQAQDGFVTSNDFRQFSFYHSYTVYFDNSFVENVSLKTNSVVKFNYDGVRKYVGSSVQAHANLKGQTYAYVNYYPLNNELFHAVQFNNLYRTEAYLSTKPINSLSFNIWAQIGRRIYYTDTPQLGRGYNFSGEVVLKPTNNASLDITYAHTRLWSYSSNELFFDGYVARTSMVYQFSPELFVRLISQYDGFAKQLQIDPLVSFKLNPFTVFYLGSAHNFTKFDNPFGMTRTVQQFFVKLQYLWQN